MTTMRRVFTLAPSSSSLLTSTAATRAAAIGLAATSFRMCSGINNNSSNSNSNSSASPSGKGPSTAEGGARADIDVGNNDSGSGAGMSFAGAGKGTSSSGSSSSSSFPTHLTARGAQSLTRVPLKRTTTATTAAATATPFSASELTEGPAAVKAEVAAAATAAAVPKGTFSRASDETLVSGLSRAESDILEFRDLTAAMVPESATGATRAQAASGGDLTEEEAAVLRRRKQKNGAAAGEEDGSGDGSSSDGAAAGNSNNKLMTADQQKGLAENEVIEALGSPLYGTLQQGSKIDHGPLRPTGMWSVGEVVDEEEKTVDFRRIDDVESEIMESLEDRDSALVLVDDEEKWKHKLMFNGKFKKTPKHLTWKELGQEIDCLDCVIDLDPHRPEERFSIKFQFIDKRKGTRDVVWEANNDVSYSEGFTDLMAAIGSCLGRADVFRTIRFDDGRGTTREVTIRKKSRFTSDIQLSFRPAVNYNVYERKEANDNWEKEMSEEGLSPWGFHPQLMDPEYRDLDDPEGTYTISLSAHAFSFIMLRCIDRLITRPLKDFYRPSQVAKRAKTQKAEEIGVSHAVMGWLGLDEQIYPHYTPVEAIQEHYLGPDAPFTLVAIINKLREMTYLKKKNPEFSSWLAVRKHDTAFAIRNISVKMLGAGASTLFVPRTHNSTANFLLPKNEQRRLESKFSLNAMLGMPDETKNIAEFKKITGNHKISSGEDGVEKKDDSSEVKSSGDSAAATPAGDQKKK